MAPATVQTATATYERSVIDVMTLAFSGDPALRWLYPEPHQYLSCFPEFARALGGPAIPHGTAHYMDGFAGAALWLPPGVAPNEDALVDLLQRTVDEPKQEIVFSVLAQMNAFHPTEPHWYLPLIGVDPAHQRQGYGSVLLQHVLKRCDREGAIAYLESSNPENMSLYERHGFEALGTIQVETSPPFMPMMRHPANASDDERPTWD